jgi:flagellar assembly protein FliH
MNSSSLPGRRLIRGDALAAPLPSWQAPDVALAAAGPVVDGPAAPRSAEEQRKLAWQQGFEQGQAAGREAVVREDRARVAVLERVLDSLTRPLADLDHRVEEELLALVTAVARHVIRREMHHDPGHLVGVIREGLAALPIAADDIRVRLHPEDAAVVQACLPGSDSPRRWRLELDPLLERGGCVILSSRSQVDERLETRLGRVLATLFSDERHG